jgi:hypothetical protein
VKPISSTAALKPTNGAHRVTKPATPARSTPTAPSNSASTANKTPKKGTYAEIMARAKKAQEAMGQVGKIQHKKAEKKDREAAAISDPRASAKRPTASSGYQGTAKPGQKPGLGGSGMRNGTAAAKGAAAAARAKPAASERERKAAEAEQEKRFKKAAQATTGYTGTARPRPGAPTKKAAAVRGGALLNQPPRPRGSGHKSRYEDDYDEELEDFIEYDEEEEEMDGGPGYHYDSDGSSDMEAGLDDIDVEERKAERIARLEDLKEQELEKSLKAAKEERKRKALEGLRAKRR